MVGHIPLEDGIQVRVLVPQPSFRIRFFAKMRSVARKNFFKNRESIIVAAYLEPSQTFEIILPNLIHKSKKRNLR